MTDHDKRGIRPTGMRARLAIAAAVIAAGGAASVVAVSASHGDATAAQSTAFTAGHTAMISESTALSRAFSEWPGSPARSLATLAQMTPVRSFRQVRAHGATFALQRGVVVLATRKFLVVKSAGGGLHLWWISRATRFRDVAATSAGMDAMTGSGTATAAAMTTGDMTPAATVMAGSASALTQLTTAAAKPATISISTGGEVITITVAQSTATVTQPMTMTTTRMTRGTQPAFRSTRGVHRGDLVLVAGTRGHGALMARIVLFAPSAVRQPAPGVTATPSMTATPGVTATPSPGSTLVGKHS